MYKLLVSSEWIPRGLLWISYWISGFYAILSGWIKRKEFVGNYKYLCRQNITSVSVFKTVQFSQANMMAISGEFQFVLYKL